MVETRPRTPELEDLYPTRSPEHEKRTQRHLVELRANAARRLDRKRTAMLEAVALYVAVDILLIGLAWQLFVADLVIGCAVGYAWDRWRTGTNASAAIGAFGFVLTCFALGLPSLKAMIWVMLAAFVVAALSGWMAKQRMSTRMGI